MNWFKVYGSDVIAVLPSCFRKSFLLLSTCYRIFSHRIESKSTSNMEPVVTEISQVVTALVSITFPFQIFSFALPLSLFQGVSVCFASVTLPTYFNCIRRN